MTSRHTHRVAVLVAGNSLEAPAIRHNPAAYQSELRAARAKYGSARCLCQEPPRQLVIREREGRLFLAAWPREADQHALDCPFYGEHATTTGAAAYAPSAIDARGDHTAVVLAHPLNHPGQGASAAPPREPRARTQAKQHLNGWGLLHHLWEFAAMNRWHPGWTRDWGFVRYALRKAAQSTKVDGLPLIERLYVPPVYVPSRAQETSGHWKAFCEPLLRLHRGRSEVVAGIVIGLVRDCVKTNYGYYIRLQHHFERLYLDERTADNLSRFSRPGWCLLERRAEADPGKAQGRVVAALRVEANTSQKLLVVEGALMRVSADFIPVNSSYEEELAIQLVVGDRAFARPLSYDNHTMQLPHFILSDVAGDSKPASRLAMYVYGPGTASGRRASAEHEDHQAASRAGMNFWAWNLARSGAPPPLPPARPRQPTLARQVPVHLPTDHQQQEQTA